MAYCDPREESSYGFKSDITSNLQFRGHLMDNLGSKVPAMSPGEQICIGFRHLDVGADGRSNSMNQFGDYSRPLDMSSALNSVALNQIWDFKTPSLEFCSVAEPKEDGSTVFQLDNVNGSPEGESDPVEDEAPSVTFQSKYFDFFPLYQDYFLQTVRDEMLRLKGCYVSELISPQCFHGLKGIHRSDLYESDPIKPQSLKDQQVEVQSPPDRALPSTPPQSVKVTSFTLWQDLDVVKASGLLRFLTPKEIRLQESMFELIGSEASYLKSLGVVVDHFQASKVLRKSMSKMDHKSLFSNICHVMAASARFLNDLEARLDENPLISQVGDIVLKHCKDFLQHYVPYVTNMTYQEALVNRLLQHNQDFVNALKKLESNPVCQRQTLKSFLVLPFQRITRMKLLLESILKLTEPDSQSASDLKDAINAIHEIVTSCDTKVRKMKQIEELVCLEMLMDFSDVKSVPLVISTRFLIHQGPVKQLTVEAAYGSRMSFIKIYLHLFNDLLIISFKKYQHFKVVDHALFPAHVTIEHLKTEAVGLPPDSFLLRLSRSQKGPPTAMILVAKTRSDKDVWMKVLSSK